jgi:hypothetical protein
MHATDRKTLDRFRHLTGVERPAVVAEPVQAAVGRVGICKPQSADEVSTFLPAANYVVSTAAPLCSLSGTKSLLTQCIYPLPKVHPTLKG